MASKYRQQLEAWLKAIEVKCDRCLDVGGSAYPISTKGRLKSFECKEFKVLDNGNEESFHDKWRKPDIELDLNKGVVSTGGASDVLFDVIFCLEVFEYIYDPVCALRNLRILVKNGGIMYISFPTIYGVHQPVGDDSLRFKLAGIKKLLENASFKILDIVPRRATAGAQDLLNFYSKEGMRIAKCDQVLDIGYMVKCTSI